MKKTLLLLTLLFSAAALTSCGNSDGASKKNAEDAALRNQLLDKAAELTERYSDTGDAFTRFDSITVPDNRTMQFNYRLLFATSDMLTPGIIAMWTADAYPALLDGIKRSEDLPFFSNLYVKIVYHYSTNDGAEFTALTFTRSGYNRYAASRQKPYAPPSASNPPSDEDIAKCLSFIAAELNAGCPRVLNNDTRIDSVVAQSGKTLQHHYTLSEAHTSLQYILRSQILYSIKADRSAKWMTMKNCGVTFVYSYSNDDGQPLFTLAFTPDDYNAPS